MIFPDYSNAFSEQGAARGCGSHGGPDLAGAPGTPVHEQDEFDEWHRESRGLKMYVAETSSQDLSKRRVIAIF